MNFTRLNLISLSVILLSGCGGGRASPADVNSNAQSLSRDKVFSGPLLDGLKEIQDSTFQEDCDLKQNSIKTELVNVLVKNKDKVESNQSGSIEPSENLVPFQNSFLIQYPFPKSFSHGWVPYESGWDAAYDYYKKNLEKPSKKFWPTLNYWVRSLMSNDKRRIVNGVNGDISYHNVDILLDLKKTLESCDQSSTCYDPVIAEAILSKAKKIEYYRYYLNELKNENSLSAKRKLVTRFLNRVTFDWEVNADDLNPSLISKMEGNKKIYSLSIDASTLGQKEQSLIQSTIESIWKNESASLKIKFEPAKTDLFQILFHPNRPGERDYVSYSKKTMNLFPFSPVRSIAHEFGHVLGFADHYYTLWDSAACQYIQESNGDDLMSDSETGIVTHEEWKTLEQFKPEPQS